MILKAGAYTFNNELTIDKEFSQNINIVLSASEADSSGELHCSRIWTADNNNMLVVDLYKMVIREGGEEIVEEIEEPQPFPIYYKGSFVGDIPISQTHTITDDTDVSNTFAAWYIANTDYVEVNGGEVPDIPEEPDEPEEPDIPEPVTISFSINRNGTVYNLGAEEGMTWREWVSSDYNNTALGVISGDPDYIAFTVGQEDVLDVGVDDVIVDGQTYYTIVDEPEEPEVPEVPEEPEEPKPEPRTIEFSFQEDEHSYGGDAQEGSTWREWVVKQNSKYWQIVSDDTEYIMHTLNDGRRYRLDVAVDNVIEEFRTYYLILILEPSPRRFSRLYDGVVLQESGEKKIKRVQAEWLGYELSDDETYYTCTGFGASQGKKVIIASDIGGIPVTHIGSNAFQYCSTPISIIIPNSVTNINGSTFRHCYSLKNITIPASVTSGSVGFNCCTALESIEVEDDSPKYKSIDGNLYNKDGTSLYQYALGKKDTSFTVPETVSYIQGGAFEGCLYLKDINIPGGALTTIREGAFHDCESLKNITIGNVNQIRERAFGYCYNLENITISSAVTSIDPFAFYRCYSIKNFIVDADNPEYEAIDGSLYTKINKYQTKYLWRYASGKKDASFTIPDSVTTIAQQAFNWSLSLKNVIIPDSVTNVGSYAFSYCDNLESVTMGNSVKVISHYAFENCSKLANINLPDSLTYIGDLAFSGCSLTSITIPSSVNYIGEWGLNCRKLNNIIFKGTVEQWNAISLGENWNLNVPATYVHCIDGKVLLKHSEGLAFTSNGDDTCYVSGIGTCTNTDIVIPSVSPEGDRVTSIGEWAFRGRTSLTSIVIPDSVTSFGEGAFAHCTSLTSIEIPDSVTWTGNHTFAFCTSLKSVVIPNSVTAIGYNAFDTCSSLTSVTIPNSITTIYEQAFKWCTLLTDIIFEGTMAQWEKITLYPFWNNEVPATYVQCTDGQVAL